MKDVWQEAFRAGVAGIMTVGELTALRDGLAADDPQLIQGVTVVPHRGADLQSATPKAACAIGYAAWKGSGLTTTGDVYARVDDLWVPDRGPFIRYWDETPRDVAFPAVLAEVDAALKERETVGV